jgi:hypothetical protein
MSRFNVARRARDRDSRKSARLLVGAVFAVVAGLAVLHHAAVNGRVDASDTALAHDSVREVEVRVSPDETTLEFRGPIVVGVAERVRGALDAHPHVTAVRLTSPGGRVVEARDLGDVISERGLVTVAVGSCSSACTIAFMAGRERLLAPATTLGFHRYHSPDPEQQEAEANMMIDRRYFSERGLPGWFIEQAFTTPNNGMWRPSVEDMKTANVITGQLAADDRRLGATVAIDASPRIGP